MGIRPAPSPLSDPVWCVYTSSISIFRKNISNSLLSEAKEAGFSDKQIGKAMGVTEKEVRQKRIEANIKPWVKQVSTPPPHQFYGLFQFKQLIMRLDISLVIP